MKKNVKNKRNRKPLPTGKGTKNARRDEEIYDTSRKEFSADSRDRRDCYRSEGNDPAWYAQNPQLLIDYASYPFGKPVGQTMQMGSGLTSDYAIPGVLVYRFAPAAGLPDTPNDPINIAMRNIYSFVRHANSGHTNYDAPDLMVYLVCMDSVYMFHSFMRRIAGLVLDYTTLNRYWPKTIVESMGVDYDDISHHIQDFRGFINIYAAKMGSMCVPNSMSYMARHTWMTEGIYTDSSAAKAQTYLYSPTSFYKFTLIENASAAQLVHLVTPNSLKAGLLTMSELMDFGNSLLNPILSNEDLNIMSGDILKAFGDNGVVKVSGISEAYQVLPQFNQEVLSQMENATVWNGLADTTLMQETGVGSGYLVLQQGACMGIGSWDTTPPIQGGDSSTAAANLMKGRKILNFHHDGVTPAEVMVSTRLTNMLPSSLETLPTASSKSYAVYSSNTAGSQVNVSYTVIPVIPEGLGSEVIESAEIYVFSNASSGFGMVRVAVPTMSRMYYTSTYHDALLAISWLSNFDWHHEIHLGTPTTTSTTVELSWTPGVWDVDNYTVIDSQNLTNMTQAALLSEFSVPQMGAFAAK